MNEFVYQMFFEYIKGQVGDDEELLRKVTPDYAPMGKRTLQDNGSWLSALKRDNVDLVTQSAASVSEGGVTSEDGSFYPADIIIYATGFQTDKFLWPMAIKGRRGQLLSRQWGDEPSAYLGITVPNFPQFLLHVRPGYQPGLWRQPHLQW